MLPVCEIAKFLSWIINEMMSLTYCSVAGQLLSILCIPEGVTEWAVLIGHFHFVYVATATENGAVRKISTVLSASFSCQGIV